MKSLNGLEAIWIGVYTNTETWATAPVSARVMEEIEASDAPITGIAGMDPKVSRTRRRNRKEQVLCLRVTPEFFSMIAPRAAGHGFSEGDRDVVILSWSFVRRALDGDPAAIGPSIVLDGTAHTVVGVKAQGFAAPYWPNAEVLRPLDLDRAVRSAALVLNVPVDAPGIGANPGEDRIEQGVDISRLVRTDLVQLRVRDVAVEVHEPVAISSQLA